MAINTKSVKYAVEYALNDEQIDLLKKLCTFAKITMKQITFYI